jgi:para-aminobenzoate synthetase component 1
MRDAPPHTALALHEIGRDPSDPATGPLAAFERLRGDGPGWLLDSALRVPGLGDASFLGASPWAVARIRGNRCSLEVLREVDPRFARGRHVFSADPLDWLRRLLPRRPSEASGACPAFCGGAVGYLGYELAESLDVHRLRGRDDLGLPDAVFLLVDRVLAFDHAAGRVTACGLGLADDAGDARRRAAAAADALRAELERPADTVAQPPRPAGARAHPRSDEKIQPSDYAKAVDRVREEIAAGNVYQACLTRRATRRFGGDPWRLYRELRRVNPAPFACFLDLPEVAVVGSSPERFLRVGRDGAVESRPIKGTARRGRDPVEDAARRRELAGSEKDRAENLMIVDLVRNDLSRVCVSGSVHVPELMLVEAYASVFQLVSTVRGRLAEDRDALDAVRAAFPPGSMTGAPKIAAMALLDELEPVRRTLYAGAIGYLDVFGGADLSVVIRTALLQDGRAFLHAGGGIVSDSEPAAEYREALDKLTPLLAALDAAEAR